MRLCLINVSVLFEVSSTLLNQHSPAFVPACVEMLFKHLCKLRTWLHFLPWRNPVIFSYPRVFEEALIVNIFVMNVSLGAVTNDS